MPLAKGSPPVPNKKNNPLSHQERHRIYGSKRNLDRQEQANLGLARLHNQKEDLSEKNKAEPGGVEGRIHLRPVIDTDVFDALQRGRAGSRDSRLRDRDRPPLLHEKQELGLPSHFPR